MMMVSNPDLIAAGRESKRRALRVLAIIEGNKVSGPAKNVLELCRTARTNTTEKPIDITIARFQRSTKNTAQVRGESNELVDAASRNGVPIVVILERFRFDTRVISRLYRLVRELRPDLIETHAVKSHFLARISGVGKKIPWIAFHHGYTQTNRTSPLYNCLDLWSLRAPARVVTMCGPFKKQLANRGIRESNITVLHNSVSTSLATGCLTSPQRQSRKMELGLRPDDRVILCVGRLSREKAQIDLIGALDNLQKLEPRLPVSVVFLGDGPERSRIEQAARSLDLQDQVSLLGHDRDITQYYEIADVVAIPSISEGSPNVLLEAMAAGVPVAATKVGGIPEIVTDGETALLVEPRRPAAMAKAIHRLLSSAELSQNLAYRARELVESRFSPIARAQLLTDLYVRAYGEARSAAGLGSAPGMVI
jgi:glycosyltransferase involved in cell wall biosynthesis